MGSSQSTRRVTINNATTADLITVSESVAKRLRGEEETKPKEEKTEKPREEKRNSFSNNSNFSSPKENFTKNNQKKNAEAAAALKSRIDKLEKLNDQLYKKTIQNFKSSLANVEKNFIDQTCSPVCQEQQQIVMDCYDGNSKTSLNCSQEVARFKKCVDQVRVESLIKAR